MKRVYNLERLMDNARPVVVITGSTRGIGLGLAEAFLARGCAVVVSGRSSSAVNSVVDGLAKDSAAGQTRVVGRACDVADGADLEALWNTAVEAFGRVDIWINNAGSCNPIRPFTELTAAEITSVVDTNLRGTMLGSHVALQGLARQGHGQLFNMEGWGSRGERKPGMTPYCATKLALRYFTDELAREVSKSAPKICIGTLSPGMVVTDSLIESYRKGGARSWAKSRWLFNFVIDPREKVCAWLADRILENQRTGVHFVWMTPMRLLVRFLNPRYWRRNPVSDTPLDRLGQASEDGSRGS
jgi:NAD(P)-dependent dehydrogenase (short-subunit alcohol dehydrogenase family)